MLNETVRKALNTQLNNEMYSSYLYLSMASYFEAENLNGFAHWMKLQAGEEYAHAMKLYDFINERGGKVDLGAIDAPATTWDSIVTVIEESRAHEGKVTKAINALVDLAIAEKDHATNIFLQWYVTEQVEEEATGDDLLFKVKMASQSPQGIYLLDQELAGRVAGPAE